jgi:hypothetical protein
MLASCKERQMATPGRTFAQPAGSKARGPLRSRLELALQKLGGRRLLGVEVRSEADFVKVVEREGRNLPAVRNPGQARPE